jgi:hypothetical protein
MLRTLRTENRWHPILTVPFREGRSNSSKVVVERRRFPCSVWSRARLQEARSAAGAQNERTIAMSSCYTEEGMRAAGQVPAYVEASSGEFVRVESATPDELKHGRCPQVC